MSKKIPGQFEINFNQPKSRCIPKSFDEKLALDARAMRNRRLGKAILNQRNAGFLSIDKGLWIPGSRGEITAAIDSPELMINKSRLSTYERTQHRGYAKKAANETRKKIENYYNDASEHRWMLSKALLINPFRAFTEYTVTNSEIAMEGIIRYIQDLKSFIDKDWPQKRWKRYGANKNKATKEVKSLYVDELLDMYEEAFWSVRSRMRFWHIRGMNALEPPASPPIPFSSLDPTEFMEQS